ncbi:SAM-dependent methyltransferase [Niveispirillum lacus]|uniref:SAM-dependent methyltransferase n=1 Tax=Niveispirillum lacus TaxID=1981099 RepID=A0A255YYB9_9PROT|nr:methyltransferase domain-containing protein [Niveispirillum lacus]OYQ33665.1 SAM-dependent methyltransferase [Niveispirillum lacus]
MTAGLKTFLHAGCGEKRRQNTTKVFAGDDWQEIRLDIDPAVGADIVGPMTKMDMIATGSIDAVYSSHSLEHHYAHEVPVALAECRRILKPDGFMIIVCPDLQGIATLVAKGRLMEPYAVSPAGPIAAIDVLFGYRPSLAAGNQFMLHRTGFTRDSMAAALKDAGFKAIAGISRGYPFFDLWMVASNAALNDNALRELAAAHFPEER